MLVSCSGACPPWTVYSSASGECQCGDGLFGVVHCDRVNPPVYTSLLTGMCAVFGNRVQVQLPLQVCGCCITSLDHILLGSWYVQVICNMR